MLLESLDNLHRAGEQLVRRAQTLANADDIHGRIVRVASGFERLAEVQPDMFEDVVDEELAKYDRFLGEIADNGEKQAGILSDIKVGDCVGFRGPRIMN